MKGDQTLEDGLWRVVAPLVKTPGRARDLTRAEALAPGKGRPALYAAVASGDPEWVAAHAEDIARATPAAVDDLILALQARIPYAKGKPVIDRLRAVRPANQA